MKSLAYNTPKNDVQAMYDVLLALKCITLVSDGILGETLVCPVDMVNSILASLQPAVLEG